MTYQETAETITTAKTTVDYGEKDAAILAGFLKSGWKPPSYVNVNLLKGLSPENKQRLLSMGYQFATPAFNTLIC
jgi:hypothetical protein